MYYIQRKDNRFLETVGEYQKFREAMHDIREYRLCDPFANYYISSRACKEWWESGNADIEDNQGA